MWHMEMVGCTLLPEHAGTLTLAARLVASFGGVCTAFVYIPAHAALTPCWEHSAVVSYVPGELLPITLSSDLVVWFELLALYKPCAQPEPSVGHSWEIEKELVNNKNRTKRGQERLWYSCPGKRKCHSSALPQKTDSSHDKKNLDTAN